MTGVDVLARMLPSLLVIVGALLVLRHWSRRGSGAAGSGVRVLTRTGISKGAVVAVVAVGDRRLLVGATEQGVQLLTELDDDPVASPTAPPQVDGAVAAQAVGPDLDIDLDIDTGGPGPRPARMPWSNDRPRMAPIDRLRHLTVRTPVPSRPRRSNVAHHRP